MVLQRSPLVAHLEGFCDGCEDNQPVLVVVKKEITGSEVARGASKVQSGRWSVALDQPVVATTDTVSVTASAELGSGELKAILTDVLFGDVWLCSGQSNMEFGLSMMLNASTELDRLEQYSKTIRFMSAGKCLTFSKLNELPTIRGWTRVTNDTVGEGWGHSSAICYVFGRKVHDSLGGGVPIGLIESDDGGTMIHAWTPEDALVQCKAGADSTSLTSESNSFKLRDSEAHHKERTSDTNFETECNDYDGGVMKTSSRVCCTDPPLFVVPPTPRAHNDSVLYNAMIQPLTSTVIKGIIVCCKSPANYNSVEVQFHTARFFPQWFQGESDSSVNNAVLYNCTFPAMIAAWRKAWFSNTGGLTDQEFPFGFLQLGAVGCTCQRGHQNCTCPSVDVATGFSIVRWSQTAGYGYVPNPKMPNTFMAVAMDLPDEYSPWGTVHFRNKLVAGERVATAALAAVYGQRERPSFGMGPVIKSIDVVDSFEQNANQLRANVIFSDTSPERGPLRSSDGFEFGFVDPVMSSLVWINATIVSTPSGLQLILNRTATMQAIRTLVSSTTVPIPVAVRYAWQLSPCYEMKCALYSMDGLPAPPFIQVLANSSGRLSLDAHRSVPTDWMYLNGVNPSLVDPSAMIPRSFFGISSEFSQPPKTPGALQHTSSTKALLNPLENTRTIQPKLPERYHLRQEYSRPCSGPRNESAYCRYYLVMDFDLTNESANEYGTSPWGWIARKQANGTLSTFRYGESCMLQQSILSPISKGNRHDTVPNVIQQFPPTNGLTLCQNTSLDGMPTQVFCNATTGEKLWMSSYTPVQYYSRKLSSTGVVNGTIRIADFSANIDPGVFIVPAVWNPVCSR